MPPLSQIPWMLLVASLCALAGWGVVRLAALTHRKQAKMREIRYSFSPKAKAQRLMCNM